MIQWGYNFCKDCFRERGAGMKRNEDYFRGCLIGGAIGDALGAPVELLSHAARERRYGTGGIRELEPPFR